MSGHIVQFYEKESFLSGVVADFLGGGLAEGRQAVVIATPSHRRAFADELTARGVDVDDRLLLLDAEETLALFMEDGQPDAHRFKAAVGGILEPEARAYGEMADLLSRPGRARATPTGRSASRSCGTTSSTSGRSRCSARIRSARSPSTRTARPSRKFAIATPTCGRRRACRRWARSRCCSNA